MGTIRLFKVWLLIGLMVLSGGPIAFAQTNTFPSSGDVGIGTTSPGTKLEVYGTQAISGGGTNSGYLTFVPGAGATINIRTLNGGHHL